MLRQVHVAVCQLGHVHVSTLEGPEPSGRPSTHHNLQDERLTRAAGAKVLRELASRLEREGP